MSWASQQLDYNTFLYIELAMKHKKYNIYNLKIINLPTACLQTPRSAKANSLVLHIYFFYCFYTSNWNSPELYSIETDMQRAHPGIAPAGRGGMCQWWIEDFPLSVVKTSCFLPEVWQWSSEPWRKEQTPFGTECLGQQDKKTYRVTMFDAIL